MSNFKKLLMLFLLLGMSAGAGAATITLDTSPSPFAAGFLDPTESAGVLSGGYNISNLTGSFNENITFNVVGAPSGAPGSANVVSVLLAEFFGVNNLQATLTRTGDATNPLDVTNPVPSLTLGVIDTILTNGFYTLNLFGDTLPGGATLSGNVAISPSAVPIPAAVWLFGSGLLGVFGVNRRFKGNA